MALAVKARWQFFRILKDSSPEAYVKAITDLVRDPERYYHLCATTRLRYEKELNWTVAGERLNAIFRDVVEEGRPVRR